MHNLCLHNRTQLVRVGSVSSNPTTLATDVPQGCVLGPVLFSAYILHIGSLIGTHNLQHPQYTNDTQMFISVHLLIPHTPSPGFNPVSPTSTVGFHTMLSFSQPLEVWRYLILYSAKTTHTLHPLQPNIALPNCGQEVTFSMCSTSTSLRVKYSLHTAEIQVRRNALCVGFNSWLFIAQFL